MINFSIPYKKNKKTALLEQAAGFPPFTRGYYTVGQSVKISKPIKTDFALSQYTDKSILNLFSEIILHQAKGKISVTIPFIGKAEEIVYVCVLRTLLSFVSDKLYNNSTSIQFEFHGVYYKEFPSLNSLIYAKAAQLNVLVVNNDNDWANIQLLLPQMPVDSLYDSKYLENKISTLFFPLWKLIVKILT